MVRAGAHGEQEQFAIEHNIVTIGWNELADIRDIKDKYGPLLRKFTKEI